MISVILTYYKKKQFIKRCLNSIINQTYKNFETILVYDDNKKQTYNLFEGNKHTKIWINGWVEHAYPQEKLNSIADALSKHIQNADPKYDLTQPNFWLLEPSDWLTFKHYGHVPPDIHCNTRTDGKPPIPLLDTLNAMSFVNDKDGG